jgi:hypothetical protein
MKTALAFAVTLAASAAMADQSSNTLITAPGIKNCAQMCGSKPRLGALAD